MTDKPTCIRDWIAIEIIMKAFFMVASPATSKTVAFILSSNLKAWKQHGEHPQLNKDESK